MSALNHLLLGSVATCAMIAALFFLRFWRRTRDRFFLLFSIAFAIDAVHRVTIALVEISDESQPGFFLVRLLVYLIILTAIIDKNFAGRK